MRESHTETPGTIGVVKRFHAAVRAAYDRIRNDMELTASDMDCLKMATFTVNATVGREGLCPTLLEFGDMSRPSIISPSPSQIHRGITIEKEMREVYREKSRIRIEFGLIHQSGPNDKEYIKNRSVFPNG